MGTGKFTLTPLPRNRAMVTPVSSEVVRVEPIRSRAPAARRSSPARTAPSHSPAFARAYNDFKRTPRERDVDVCAELFKFCKACEERFLETCGISCLFDVDSGAMPRATFQTLCTIIEVVIMEIADNRLRRTPGASLTITLRHQKLAWILAISERRISSKQRAPAARRLSLVRKLTQFLGGTCRVQETSDGLITAIMFMTVPSNMLH